MSNFYIIMSKKSIQEELNESVEKGRNFVVSYRSKNPNFIRPDEKHYTFVSAVDFFTQLGNGALDILKKEGKLFIEDLKNESVFYQQFARIQDLFNSKFGAEAFLRDTFNDTTLERDARSMIQKQLNEAKEAGKKSIHSAVENNKRQKEAKKKLAEIEGVKDVIKVLPNETERTLFTYNNSTNVLEKTTDDNGYIAPVILGVNNFKEDFINELNNANEYLESIGKDAAAKDAKSNKILEANMIKARQFKLPESDDDPIFALVTHVPDMIYQVHNISKNPTEVLKYTTPYADLGYESFAKFLTADDDTRIQNAKIVAQKLNDKYIDPPFSHNNTMSFFNDSIEALAKSMPDFASNMFDVLIGTYKRDPESFQYKEWFDRKDGQFIKDIDLDTSHYPKAYKKFVNYYNFVFRVASISIPQSTTQVNTVSFLNRKIPVASTKSSIKNQSTFSFRADQALFFTDEIQKLSGSFIYKTVDSTHKASDIQQTAKQALYGTMFMPFGPAYNLSEDNENKINIYVPMYDSSLDTEFRHSIFDPYLMSDKDYYSNIMKIKKIPVFCFEDVRFLGNSDISLNSQSGGPIDITVNFIYRRLYKFYTDFRRTS